MARSGRSVADNIKLSIGLAGTTVDLRSRRTSEKADSFKRICPICAAGNVGTKVKQVNTCPKDAAHGPFQVPELAKGKEISKTQVVPLTADEIAAVREVENATGKEMELNFHPAEQVAHLIPTGISYACVPDGPPDNFYGVLAHKVSDPSRVCLGRLVLSGKEKLFRVTVGPTGLIVSEMCRDAELYDTPVTDTSFDPKFLPMADQLVEMVTTNYDPTMYEDHTADRLAELLAAKAADPSATVTTIAPKAPTAEADLMAAMEASLAALMAGKDAA